MIDPLRNFDWPSLYAVYDARCHGFDPTSRHLDVLQPDLPPTYRATYYRLIMALAERNKSILAAQATALYEALLYWKLYSQGQANPLIWQCFDKNSSMRQETQKRLSLLFESLPATLERNATAVLETVKLLGNFAIPGMKTATALPVRTTFLHFMYPSVVPIFDKMVLQAVGIREKGANQKTKFLREYLPFAWDLTDRYTQNISGFGKEGPIRVIDMALWVARGQGDEHV